MRINEEATTFQAGRAPSRREALDRADALQGRQGVLGFPNALVKEHSDDAGGLSAAPRTAAPAVAAP